VGERFRICLILLVIDEAVKQYSSSYHTTKIKRMYEHAKAAFVVISRSILNEVYVRTLTLFLILFLLFLSLLLSFFPFLSFAFVVLSSISGVLFLRGGRLDAHAIQLLLRGQLHLGRQAQLFQPPNQIPRHVDLPPLQAVSGAKFESVVVVVPPFSKC
jgi:hypothetical protein